MFSQNEPPQLYLKTAPKRQVKFEEPENSEMSMSKVAKNKRLLSFGKTVVDPLEPTKSWQKLSTQIPQTLLTDVFGDQPKPVGSVRIVTISDTHGKHAFIPKIPDGDILIHAGDITISGDLGELRSFIEWMGKQPHKHKVVIAGNHDITLDESFYDQNYSRWHGTRKKDDAEARKMMREQTHFSYLEDSVTTVEGLKIFGSPYSSYFHNWAYNCHRGPDSKKIWDVIPDDTDVLVTHGPALGFGDEIDNYFTKGERVGCANLLHDIIYRVKPKLHVAGHIHEAIGCWTNGKTTFVQAATCNLRYKPNNPPIVVDVMADNSPASDREPDEDSNETVIDSSR